jgi:hypothetical protein
MVLQETQLYIYTWKYHKEMPCVAILSKQKCHVFSFTQSDNRREGQDLLRRISTCGRWEEVGKGEAG